MSEISAGYLSGEQYKFGLECFHVAVQFVHKNVLSLKSQIEIVQMAQCQHRTRGRPASLCLVIRGSRQFCQSY